MRKRRRRISDTQNKHEMSLKLSAITKYLFSIINITQHLNSHSLLLRFHSVICLCLSQTSSETFCRTRIMSSRRSPCCCCCCCHCFRFFFCVCVVFFSLLLFFVVVAFIYYRAEVNLADTTSRKHLRTKVSPDFHLTYSKTKEICVWY